MAMPTFKSRDDNVRARDPLQMRQRDWLYRNAGKRQVEVGRCSVLISAAGRDFDTRPADNR